MKAGAHEAVVIGASAGALEALSVLLPALPADYAVPVMIVVHVPADKTSLLAELFQGKSAIKIIEAEDKMPISKSVVYFAPPAYHLLVEPDRTLSLSSDPPVLFSCPSIDVLFESAADAYGAGLLAVILSGANADGANGVKAVMAAGGRALVQAPGEAFAAFMPRAAIKSSPGAQVLTLDEIARYLRSIR